MVLDPETSFARASRLRAEAEAVRRHGFTNFFAHTFACLTYGQVPRARAEARCGPCPFRPFVAADYSEEAFPCQHISEAEWRRAAAQPELQNDYVRWLLSAAAELEAEAAAEKTTT
ncbi:MAG: hypothetical protein ACRD4D_00690 [Candidatus Acidiferrales bacterium]